MESSFCYLSSKLLLTILCLFQFFFTNFICSMPSHCHGNERSALLQFKESLTITKSASSDNLYSYSKVESWKLAENSDCCLWEGVTCDDKSGNVIVLDLSSSNLYGSINSNSTIFQLVHLQRLDLADNDFNHSQIPAAVRYLSRLTYLNLSSSVFAGHVPAEILQLSKLSSLDLSNNQDPSTGKHVLKLGKHLQLGSLVGNLSRLEHLHLRLVKISSSVPEVLANLSSLKSLHLMGCALSGEFPITIFYLPNLQVLNLINNPKLIGHFPDFKSNSPLETLLLRGTNFSGQFPVSIGSLHSLVDFDIQRCEFFGSIPPSIYNLTQLRVLSLGYNQFTGTFPSQILHLSQLTRLDIRHNKFQGPIPNSIFDLQNLEYLDLSLNEFSGIVKVEMFSKLKKLTSLYLSNNQLSLLIDETDSPSTLPRFQSLGLNSCNLSSFPYFLRDQHKLEWLELAGNNIGGLFPKWMWDCGKETLKFMNISGNSLTGFEQPPVILPWVRLSLLDLSYNRLQGSLPIPQYSTEYYSVSSNSLTGEISSLICNMSSLQVLDLSENYLSGSIPQCLFNFSYSLQALNLKRNSLSGSIPQYWTKANKLSLINLSQNKFHDQVPRSLANCTLLENLDLGDNQLSDIFPSYLAALPNLKVLILRSNKLYGPINDSETSKGFPKLHILDLSYNKFSGEFPFKLFQNWIGRKNVDGHSLTYINVRNRFEILNHVFHPQYDYAVTITNKGIRLAYNKVQEDFNAIDISSNKFEGDIPGFIGDLKELNLLNLSNNNLVGCIPASMGNLLKLESLDLSENRLSGDLPQDLAELNFLAFFNVSFNNLKGLIPRGRQFETFGNNSFLGNAELCGYPLTRKCANLENSPPLPSTTEEEEHDLFGCGWKIIMMGYGCGLVIGFSIGYTVITGKSYWFTKILRRSRRLHTRVNRRGCRN